MFAYAYCLKKHIPWSLKIIVHTSLQKITSYKVLPFKIGRYFISLKLKQLKAENV